MHNASVYSGGLYRSDMTCNDFTPTIGRRKKSRQKTGRGISPPGAAEKKQGGAEAPPFAGLYCGPSENVLVNLRKRQQG